MCLSSICETRFTRLSLWWFWNGLKSFIFIIILLLLSKILYQKLSFPRQSPPLLQLLFKLLFVYHFKNLHESTLFFINRQGWWMLTKHGVLTVIQLLPLPSTMCRDHYYVFRLILELPMRICTICYSVPHLFYLRSHLLDLSILMPTGSHSR